MEAFDPIRHVENSQLILDQGTWPNFHDAEVHFLSIWRGDVRPEDNVWTGPVLEVTFELCALQFPYLATLKFHDCESIKLGEFNHENAIYDLTFSFEERGSCKDGTQLTPFIKVGFEQAFGLELSFRCFRVEAINRKEIDNDHETTQ